MMFVSGVPACHGAAAAATYTAAHSRRNMEAIAPGKIVCTPGCSSWCWICPGCQVSPCCGPCWRRRQPAGSQARRAAESGTRWCGDPPDGVAVQALRNVQSGLRCPPAGARRVLKPKLPSGGSAQASCTPPPMHCLITLANNTHLKRDNHEFESIIAMESAVCDVCTKQARSKQNSCRGFCTLLAIASRDLVSMHDLCWLALRGTPASSHPVSDPAPCWCTFGRQYSSLRAPLRYVTHNFPGRCV